MIRVEEKEDNRPRKNFQDMCVNETFFYLGGYFIVIEHDDDEGNTMKCAVNLLTGTLKYVFNKNATLVPVQLQIKEIPDE